MKTFNSIFELLFNSLDVVNDTPEMTLFESFLLENIDTGFTDFPSTDKVYYESLEHQLKHLLYKFENGWISSDRQVINTTDECISTVHFVYGANKKVVRINVFQRSSNLLNLEDDIQFFNYFCKKYFNHKVDVSILVSMPHIFHGKRTKVEKPNKIIEFPLGVA